MMWIVRLALRRPYTFAVFAFLITLLGVFSIVSMPTDIFPNIDIPVVTVVWQYSGLSAQEMSTRIVFNSERGMTTTVNDIEHIESQSLNGIAIIKIFFQPHVNIGSAVAQVTSISQVQLRQLPPGTTPPFIIQYNASSVPVLQLGLSGQGLNEQKLNDLGQNTIRTQLATIEGAQTPFPYGGKQRQIQVDLDLHALEAKGLSPVDVVNAINAQNQLRTGSGERSERPAHQDGEWRHDLHPRCGPCARWVPPANKYRTRQRQPRHSDEHHENRLVVDVGHHQGRPGGAGEHEGPAPT
jgi:multidrug efflux pump subunit AcrB